VKSTKITAPAGPAAAGKTGPGGIVFDANGVAHTDSPAVLAYCRRAGYGIGDEPPTYQPPDLTQRDVHGREIDPRHVDVVRINPYSPGV
jgi:sugar phosphate isomerase/epimerase